MAKRRSVKNSDISNWMVVVMLVAVILVSTFSIIMFLDAAEEAAPEVASVSEGEVSLVITKDAPPNPDPEGSESVSSQVSLSIE